MTQPQAADPDSELRGSYDRVSYDVVEDGAETGDRVELRYYSPYSDTEVEVAGTITHASATCVTVELDDGREWGVFEGSIRTTENSRRASGEVRPANGRPVGSLRELRVYALGGGDPEPIFDSIETAVVSTIGAVRTGAYGGREFDRLVPEELAAEAWEFYANDRRWDTEWGDALDAAVDAGRVGTDRYGGKDRVGELSR